MNITYTTVLEVLSKQSTATIFFLPMKTRPSHFPKINMKGKYWHTGVIYQGKVYETFNRGKYRVSAERDRKDSFDNMDADFIYNVPIDPKKLHSELKTGTSFDEKPCLSIDMLSDIRILEHQIGLEELCKRTGMSVNGFTSVFSNKSLGGAIKYSVYNEILQLRKQHICKLDSTDLKLLRSKYKTHPTFRQKNSLTKYERPIESTKLIKECRHKKSKIRFSDKGKRIPFTKVDYILLLKKIEELGVCEVGRQTDYSRKTIGKLKKPEAIGRLLDPIKAHKLKSFIYS